MTQTEMWRVFHVLKDDVKARNQAAVQAYNWWRNHNGAMIESTEALLALDTPYVQDLKLRLVLKMLGS